MSFGNGHKDHFWRTLWFHLRNGHCDCKIHGPGLSIQPLRCIAHRTKSLFSKSRPVYSEGRRENKAPYGAKKINTNGNEGSLEPLWRSFIFTSSLSGMLKESYRTSSNTCYICRVHLANETLEELRSVYCNRAGTLPSLLDCTITSGRFTVRRWKSFRYASFIISRCLEFPNYRVYGSGTQHSLLLSSTGASSHSFVSKMISMCLQHGIASFVFGLWVITGCSGG
jgi:hypothetical protein